MLRLWLIVGSVFTEYTLKHILVHRRAPLVSEALGKIKNSNFCNTQLHSGDRQKSLENLPMHLLYALAS